MKYSQGIKSIQLVVNSDQKIVFSSEDTLTGHDLNDLFTDKSSKDFLKNIKKNKKTESEMKIEIDGDIYTYKVTASPFNGNTLISLFQIDEIISLNSAVKELKKYAFNDQLTGLLNRYAYWKFLENLLVESVRNSKSVGVVFVDIDNLKVVNKKHGYEGGDNVIKSVAEDIKKCTRKNDLVVRMGGDEFLVVFQVDPLKDFTVEDMCARIQARIRREESQDHSVSIGALTLKTGEVEPIVGLIWTGQPWENKWKHAISVADDYLRKAKRSGKNQAVISAQVLV